MIDTVIFDFDGTLADTNNLIINSFKHIYCKYYDGKCDVDYILSTFGEPLEKTLKRDFRSFKYEDVLKSYREFYRPPSPHLKADTPFPACRIEIE
jgi:pyrophosphatase PpaX